MYTFPDSEKGDVFFSHFCCRQKMFPPTKNITPSKSLTQHIHTSTRLQICPLDIFGNNAADGTYGSKYWVSGFGVERQIYNLDNHSDPNHFPSLRTCNGKIMGKTTNLNWLAGFLPQTQHLHLSSKRRGNEKTLHQTAMFQCFRTRCTGPM